MATSPNVPRDTVFERLGVINDKAQAPMSCSECGSTFFYKVLVEQFALGGYGSAQFRSLTTQPETLYLCTCGRPVEPTERATQNATTGRERYVKSVHMAVALFKDRAKKFQSLAAQTASVDELASLKTDLQWATDAIYALDARIKDLESHNATTLVEEDDEPEPVGEPAEIQHQAPIEGLEQISQSQQKAGRRSGAKPKDGKNDPNLA